VRQAIISRITEGEAMRSVAHSIGVNISTCKAILKVYQEEGRIGKKQKRNKVVNVVETFTFYAIADGHLEQLDNVRLQESKLSFNRHEDLDKMLEDNARTKAETLLEGIVEDKRRAEEHAAEIQRQLEMQVVQGNFGYYAINPYLFSQVGFPHGKQ
jgi:hypothetical protein